MTLNSVILSAMLVGRSVFVGRRADGNELQQAVRNGGVEIGREP
jgi:hypothetical protein